ncbi:MAG: hypothetical protein ABIS43_19315 [Opitutus sp.]
MRHADNGAFPVVLLTAKLLNNADVDEQRKEFGPARTSFLAV